MNAPSLDSVNVVLSRADLPAMADLQAAIDQWDALVRFELLDVRTGRGHACIGRFKDRVVRLTCERIALPELVGQQQFDHSPEWSAAYAFRGAGGLLSSMASFVLATGYALATDGAIFVPDYGSVRKFDMARHEFDAALAVKFDERAAYLSRYPDDSTETPQGPMTIEVIRH